MISEGIEAAWFTACPSAAVNCQKARSAIGRLVARWLKQVELKLPVSHGLIDNRS
jgi:hypothetical protein